MNDSPADNLVSDEHVAAFEEYVAKWRNLLNLRDWRIVRESRRDKRFMASVVSVEHEHKLAKYRVGVSFKSHPVTPYSLESTALHELLHILLRPLIDTAINEGEHCVGVAETEHEVIIILEELLMNAYSDHKDG
jgi:hypothetical protein